jgi:hypothetical protein
MKSENSQEFSGTETGNTSRVKLSLRRETLRVLKVRTTLRAGGGGNGHDPCGDISACEPSKPVGQ